MHADIKIGQKGYLIEGEFYARVTEVINVIRKKELEEWRGKVGNEEAERILNEAQDLGTRIHENCERILEGQDLGIEIEIEEEGIEGKMLKKFQRWAKKIDKVILLEQVVYSRKYRYAGRVDSLVEIGGQPVLLDIKTTGAIYDEVALQLAAYKEACKEMDIIEDCRRLCIRLDKKTGEIEVKEFTGSQDFEAFLCCLGLYNWLKGGKNL